MQENQLYQAEIERLKVERQKDYLAVVAKEGEVAALVGGRQVRYAERLPEPHEADALGDAAAVSRVEVRVVCGVRPAGAGPSRLLVEAALAAGAGEQQAELTTFRPMQPR